MIRKTLTILKSVKLSNKQFIWLCLISICFIYNYNHIIFERPAGIHQWRNSVSAGYPKEMYHGASFWEPQLENFAADSNNSRVMQLEFPLLYYIVALLYKIFGYHEFLYRLTNIAFGLIGLAALFKTSMLYLKDRIYSLFVSLTIFTSLIFIYYISNFITDPTGLSVALIGLYFISSHIFKKNYLHFVLAMLFFALAGLLKAQSLLLFFSFGLLLVLESVFKLRLKSNGEKVFDKPLKYYAGFIVAFAAFLGYYIYVNHYTNTHAGFTSVRINRSGIWTIDAEKFSSITDQIITRFKAGYYHSTKLIYLSGLVMLHNLIFLKKYNRILNIISYATFFQGMIVFNLVFFASLGRCDYYQINNLIFISLLFLNFFIFLKNNHPKIYQHKALKVAVVAISLVLVYHGRTGVMNRYDDWFYDYSKTTYGSLDDITPYLRSIGIEREDRVYYTPDPSINISLYLMDQLGNTDFRTGIGSIPEKIDFLKTKDLRYFMLGNEELLEKDGLAEYLSNYEQIGTYKTVSIYKIQ